MNTEVGKQITDYQNKSIAYYCNTISNQEEGTPRTAMKLQ